MVLIVVLLAFRKQIRHWLALRPASLEAGPLKINWAEQVEVTKEELAEAVVEQLGEVEEVPGAPAPPDIVVPPVDPEQDGRNLRRERLAQWRRAVLQGGPPAQRGRISVDLAETALEAPRQAIIEATRRVRVQLLTALQGTGGDAPKGYMLRPLAHVAREAGLIRPSTESAIAALNRLATLANRGGGETDWVTANEAREFLALADSTAGLIAWDLKDHAERERHQGEGPSQPPTPE
jgi:hypothetical protein